MINNSSLTVLEAKDEKSNLSRNEILMQYFCVSVQYHKKRIQYNNLVYLEHNDIYFDNRLVGHILAYA